MKYKNNPLNIRYNKSNSWLGLTGSKNGFCEFDSLFHGFRAALIILKRYRQYGKVSVTDIISRWAPKADNNNTEAYINFVCDKCDISPIEPVGENMYKSILLAMSQVEQGYYDSRWEKPLSNALFNQHIKCYETLI